MKTSTIDHFPLIAFIVSVILGGFNAIGVRFTVQELPPFWGATLRFAPAALLLFTLGLILRLPLPKGRGLLGAVIYGALNFGGGYSFIYYSLGKVKPGMATVILALVPLFTLIFAILHRQESFHLRALLGTFLAAGGVALVFREQLQSNVPILSLLSLIFGAICISESSIIAKGFPKNNPITTNAIGMFTGAIILFVISLLWHEPRNLPVKAVTWIALIFLILLGSCAFFILVLYILKHWSASTLSYQFVLLPFVAVTASAWLNGEKLNPILLVGATLVIMGVFVGVLYKPKKQGEAPSPVNPAIEARDVNCSNCP